MDDLHHRPRYAPLLRLPILSRALAIAKPSPAIATATPIPQAARAYRTADENHTIPIVSPSPRPIFRPLDRTFWSRFANVMRKPLHPPAPRKRAVFSASRNNSVAGTPCVDLHHITPPCGSHHSTHPRIFECFVCLNHRI